MVAMDFGKGTVLKRSMPLLKDVPLMYDHNSDIESCLGKIDSLSWTDDINKIPISGINGIIELDIDPNPDHPTRRIVRLVERGF